MPLSIRLPDSQQRITNYDLQTVEPLGIRLRTPFRSRVAYAAAHVVIDPVRTADPLSKPVIDFDATLAYRRYLWSLGFRVADAMDTAQRGMGLTWAQAKELIRLSAHEADAAGGEIACGANTDNMEDRTAPSLDRICAAYQQECEFIESSGSQVILMASRALASAARSPEDFENVYRRVLSGCSRPVILHWLGEAFDPALKGYWGGDSLDECMDTCLCIIEDNRRRVDGIKISLLDAQREIDMRRRLPAGVRMYTGDDFNYPELIAGDQDGHSDALLGIFDGIAPAASAALQALDRGDLKQYHALLAPTLPLSRHIFETPTYFYKTGLVFLAYLNGHQSHFRMLGAQESMRSVLHLAKLFVLADQAGLLRDPELAVLRMRCFLALSGVSA